MSYEFLCFPQDPKERLGCQLQTGFSDIKSHTFFRSIDWDLVKIITSVYMCFKGIDSFSLLIVCVCSNPIKNSEIQFPKCKSYFAFSRSHNMMETSFIS